MLESSPVVTRFANFHSTYINTEGKQRRVRVRNILKSSEKNTIFNEHPVFHGVDLVEQHKAQEAGEAVECENKENTIF